MGKKSPKVVISGYYGFDNCGDEAVLMAIVHCLKELNPGLRITILSGNPSTTRALYGVGAVNRWNPLKIALELMSCRLLISGGGSLLQDKTSSKSLRYYLAIIKMATMLGKKTMIYSQGIGPLSLGSNRKKVSKVLNRCKLITVRDERSAELLREIGLDGEIHVTSDPVMALDHDSFDGNKKPLLLTIMRSWGDDAHVNPVAEFLEAQLKNGWDVLMVPAHYPGDIGVIDKISALMTEKPRRMDKRISVREFMALTAQADMVFSMRLHGLICGFAAGAPILAISYDPKVDAFMEQTGLGKFCLPFGRFSSEDVTALSAELKSLPQEARQAQERLRLDLWEKAWNTAKQALALLD